MRISHIGWNLAGLTLPLAIAALTVPPLIKNLGEERFGLLTLAWGLIGYAGAMDLGLGRALTQMAARLLGENKQTSIPDALETASRITLITGLIGCGLIAAIATTGAKNWIHTQLTSPEEIQTAMLMLAIALPAQAMSATYKGLNEAYLNFKGINLLRASLGVINFAGPYGVTYFTNKLPWIISTLVISRLIALAIYHHLAHKCLRQNEKSKRSGKYSSKIARELFSFGGWITVSSIASPILVQADRFMIAAIISAAAVSIYVVPYEIVAQSSILVGAVSSVIFPKLSRLIHEAPSEWKKYFYKWLLRVILLMSFTCLSLSLLLPLILPIWIKGNFNPASIRVGQILCLGVFFNSIGSFFYAALHAQGRANVTAKLHLVELPIFLTALYLLISQFGPIGAAWAWCGRMLFDSTCLLYIFKRSNA